MNLLVDWCCRLLPRMRGEAEGEAACANALLHLYEKHGFNRFLMTPTFDAELEPISHFLLRRSGAAERLTPLLPRAVQLRLGAAVELTPSLSSCEDLERLTLRGNLLPLSLPLAEYADWIDLELNRLLYRRKCRLLLLSFERALVLYPQDVIDRLLRIEGAIPQFSFRSLTDPSVCRVIRSLLRQNRTVLLGTSVTSLGTAYAYTLDEPISDSRTMLHEADLQTLLRVSNAFWHKLFL